MGNAAAQPRLDDLERQTSALYTKVHEVHEEPGQEYREVSRTSNDILNAFGEAADEALENGPRGYTKRKEHILTLLQTYQDAVADVEPTTEDEATALSKIHRLIGEQRQRVDSTDPPVHSTAMGTAKKNNLHPLMF